MGQRECPVENVVTVAPASVPENSMNIVLRYSCCRADRVRRSVKKVTMTASCTMHVLPSESN